MTPLSQPASLLAPKVALVTGGSDGLGAATALELARRGARVGICARNEVRLADAETQITAIGGEVVAVPADVSRHEDLERFVQAVAERFGRIDIVVNNAGTSAAGHFDDLTDELLLGDLEQKLFAAVRLTRLALPHLRAVGGGSIVNVLNIGAKAPTRASMPTSISRAAGMAFTKALSRDLGGDNVRVNAICIGQVESGQHRRKAEALNISEEQFYATAASLPSIPLGRYGKADEFAALVAYLVSDEAAYVTGTAINFDGGMAATV
jgi:NAD(P)-dependent dehydrogenase (short-subunit alcohol dehydrogenase family)